MPEFKKIISAEQLQRELLRNKKFAIENAAVKVNRQRKEYSSFLEWYVLSKKNIRSMKQGYFTNIGEYFMHLQTQYSAELDWRNRRQRNIDFTRGRHFNEIVWDSEIGRNVTQLEYLRRRNIPPLTYNVISKYKRSLTGQFRDINTGNVVKCESRDDRGTELANLLNICFEKIGKKNDLKTKDAHNFGEYLTSGRPVFKVFWSNNNGFETEIKTRIVEAPLFSANPGVATFELENFYSAIEIVDTDMATIVNNFANGDYEKGEQIRILYEKYQGTERMKSSYNYQSYDGSQMRNMTFAWNNNSAYRYYEHWTKIIDYEARTYDPLDGTGQWVTYKWQDSHKIKKEVDQENESRRVNSQGAVPEEDFLILFEASYVTRFYVIYLTPWGDVLDVKESPYKSGKLPYVFSPPVLNGEYFGLIEELLNTQLSLDRQISLADAVNSNASKGMWLIPDVAVPDDMTNKEYINQLKRVDGAIVYKVREGFENYAPKQEYANAQNISQNIQQLIHLFANMIDDISGNYGAAQGRDNAAKTASGYAMETQNAGLNVKDAFENYLSMTRKRDELILRLMIEGYTKQDYYRITGVEIDPNELKRFQFAIESSDGTNSVAFRMQQEQNLLQFVMDGLLPFEVYTEVSTNPLLLQAKQKLDEWKKKQGFDPSMSMNDITAMRQAQSQQTAIPSPQGMTPTMQQPQITPANAS